MRSARRGSALAAGVALACIVLLLEWIANGRDELPRAFVRQWFLYNALGMVHSGATPALAMQVVLVVAITAVLACALALYILWRARSSPPARQVAYILASYGLLTFFTFVASQPRYGGHADTVQVAGYGALWFMLLSIARLLVIFPRSVDSDSVAATHWYRLRPRGPVVLPNLLHAWHRGLVDGSLPWTLTAAMMVAAALPSVMPYFPVGLWPGISFFIGVVAFGFLALAGLPFAYASAMHVYRNGTDDERRRVRWLRAVMLLFGVLLAVPVMFMALGVFGAFRGTNVGLAIAGALFVGGALMPSLFIAALAFAVLYGGAVDPRIAVTRVSAWTLLGLTITALFLLLERYAAVRIVEFFGLPQETGLVAAGAVIAATFVPLRRVVERSVTRLAERYLPIEVVADGARVERIVAITDLSGYTALSATDEPRALLLGALLKRQGDRAASKYGGRLVKSMGDAVMLTFGSAGSAVAAVRDLHDAFVPAADAVGVEPLPLHSALHRGEIVESHDGDIYGQTVNVTARLVDAAARGEIVMSAAVADALPERPALDDIGERRFKNVPEAVRCHRLAPVAALVAPRSDGETCCPTPAG